MTTAAMDDDPHDDISVRGYLRVGVRSGTPRWWRALGVAMLWWLGMLALFGIGYLLVMAVLSGR